MEIREGFSLVEIVVAMMILTVGILAMGVSSSFILNQVRASQLSSERVAAVRDAAETLRAVPWASLATECANTTFEMDPYTVECSVLAPQSSNTLQVLQLVSEGPGFQAMRMQPAVSDTFVISIARR